MSSIYTWSGTMLYLFCTFNRSLVHRSIYFIFPISFSFLLFIRPSIFQNPKNQNKFCFWSVWIWISAEMCTHHFLSKTGPQNNNGLKCSQNDMENVSGGRGKGRNKNEMVGTGKLWWEIHTMMWSSDHTVRNETRDSSVGHLISKLQNAAHQRKASHNFKTVAQLRGDLTFSQWHCWRFRFSEGWNCVVQVVFDVSWITVTSSSWSSSRRFFLCVQIIFCHHKCMENILLHFLCSMCAI